VVVVGLLMTSVLGSAQPRSRNLSDLSLEELSNVEITSASKRPERLSDAAASVFVISADDIRRSGATTLPEALRLAPNLEVAQAYANGYAISARGFNSSSANKLLVLIDGRSVYTPLFGGVFWDVQDVMLEDVERIEVISGPGGTVWGVNAVNGVINVITREAAETRGSVVSAAAGNREWLASARHGLAIADGDLRLYLKHTRFRNTETANGTDVDDASRFTQGGFRGDWNTLAGRLTVQGDTYQGKRGQPLPGTISISGVNLALDDVTTSGANLLARWERTLDADSALSVQAYYDRTHRTVPPTFAETLELADIQVQHSSRPAAGHAVVLGGEYRLGRDRLVNSDVFAFLPARVNQTWSSLFVQDEIALREELRLTLGARIERNDYTGNEWLPNVRLAWKPAADHLLWTALSRTVRAPSRLDRDTFVPGQPPFLLRGGPDFRSEIAKVFELGYRGRPTGASSLSLTVFQADYDHLRTQEVVLSPLFAFFGNGMTARVRGLEAWGTYQPLPAWRLHAGFTRLLQHFELNPGSIDASAPAAAAGANPARQLLLRSALDLPRAMELDVTVRYVSALSSPDVPRYTAVDARFAWRPDPNNELSLSARNLLGPRHGEFTDVATRSAFGRSILLGWTGHF
jgi:iron complex outermembrane receptor protein